MFTLFLLVTSGALADPYGAQIPGSTRQQSLQPTTEKTLIPHKLLYELLSIVVHHGGPQSGHYTINHKVRLPKDIDLEVRITEGDGASLLCSMLVQEQSKEIEIDKTIPLEMEVEPMGEDQKTIVWFKVSDTNVRQSGGARSAIGKR